MKNLLVSFGLFGILFVFGLFVFQQTSEAQNNITASLLDLPAPPPPNEKNKSGLKVRGEDFLSKSNPPTDDAPIDDVLEYWENQSNSYVEIGYNITPSSRNLERILAEIEKEPESLTKFLNVLPENTETGNLVKGFYDRALTDDAFTDEWKSGVKKWLTYHTAYFSDDLLKVAQRVGDANEYVTHQGELLALTAVDWEKARPILDRLIADDRQPVSQTLARWAFYKHALAENDGSDIEKYRDQLKAVTENKNATAGMRDLAIDALVKEKEWQGRDDWYASLLGDETLADLRVNGSSYTGLTTPILYAPPGKYDARMLELVGNDNAAVRSAAIRNLTTRVNTENPEVVRALLPWLENPEWAKDIGNSRRGLIGALANISMPESVPGLIAVLNEKEIFQTYRSSGMSNGGAMSNMSSGSSGNYNSAMVVSSVDLYPFRSQAITALARQKDARAIGALRAILPQVESYEATMVVGALLACKGFSVAEQIEALELVAVNVAREGEEAASETRASTNASASVSSMSNTSGRRAYSPAELKYALGVQLAGSTEVGEDLVAALIDRIGYLDTKNAALAAALRKIMLNWQSAAVNSLLLRDLKNGRADTGAVLKLLSLRKELREKQSNDIYDIRGGGAVAVGISACLLEENSEYDAILAGENADAKTTMLACARLIRAALPVGKVAENLQSPNALLAVAAERYLESEDSIEARRIVLSRHPNEAKILGATTYFAANPKEINPETAFLPELFTSVTDSQNFAAYYYLYDDSDKLRTQEEKLQKEVKENGALLGIYAYDTNSIRIYKDKADFSWVENAARYRERTLTESEFNQFKSYLSANRADELPPFLSYCEEGCESRELLMLGRQGGRRVYSKGNEQAKFFKELDALFGEMRKPPAKLHYRLEKSLAGLNVLFADDRLQARAVWKNGADFRVLLDDTVQTKQIEKELREQYEKELEVVETENVDYGKVLEQQRKRVEQRELENFAWHKIENDKIADFAAQPPQMEYLPFRDALPVRAGDQRWKTRTPSVEIRKSENGLYKISRGRMSQIREGFYSNPIVSPDGKWAVATKYFPDEGTGIARINLLTDEEFRVKLDGSATYQAVAFVPSINKVLILGRTYEREHGGDSESDDAADKNAVYFLLDLQTGVASPVKGEVRPLAQQTYRPLQPTADPNQFWAAIPNPAREETQFGIYNAKTLHFAPLLKIPQIEFDSMDVWADEPENKIYFVYDGHLLELPLPKRVK